MRVLKYLTPLFIIFAIFLIAFEIFLAKLGLAPAFSFSLALINFLLILFALINLSLFFVIFSPLLIWSLEAIYFAISGLVVIFVAGFIIFINNPSNPIGKWIVRLISTTFVSSLEKTFYPQYWIVDGKESFIVSDKDGVVYYYTLSDLTKAVRKNLKSLPKKQLKQYCNFLKSGNDGVKMKFFKAVFVLPPKLNFYPLKDKWKSLILFASEDKVNGQVSKKQIEEYLKEIELECKK